MTAIPNGSKNINLSEEIETFLPVKFRWIFFSSFRGEFENVSANQRPGRPSCFSDRPENTNFVEDVEISLMFIIMPLQSMRMER